MWAFIFKLFTVIGVIIELINLFNHNKKTLSKIGKKVNTKKALSSLRKKR